MSDETPKYPLSTVAVVSGFFLCQALGYHHGFAPDTDFDVKNTVAFGIGHLSHIFSPGGAVAWPFSPFIAGLLLSLTPYLPSLIRRHGVEGNLLLRLFTALLACLTLNTILVSVRGVRASVDFSVWLNETLGYGWLLSLVYFAGTAIVFLLAWKLFPRYYPRLCNTWLVKWKNPISIDYLCVLIAAWLFYAAYSGSLFDGMFDLVKRSRMADCYVVS